MSVSIPIHHPGAAPAAADNAAERGVSFIIEVASQTAGIVAPDGARFRFHAAQKRFYALDGQVFRTPAEAERAARKVLTQGSSAAAAQRFAS